MNKAFARDDFSPEFWHWFGSSAVVRKGGLPLVVFHRTSADFETFDTTRGDLGSHFGSEEQARDLRDGVMRDGENTRAVFLSIQRPLRLKDVGSFHADSVAPQLRSKGIITSKVAKELFAIGDRGTVAERRAANTQIKQVLMAAGFDGVVYKNQFEVGGDSWIAFNSAQIQSAIGNPLLLRASEAPVTERIVRMRG